MFGQRLAEKLGWRSLGESEPWFVRPSDERRFRLFLPSLIEVPAALQRQIETRLESMGVSVEVIAAIELTRLLSTPEPVAYPFLASASLLRPHEIPGEIMDPEEFGRPDYDEDMNAPALLRVDEAEKLSSIITLPTDAEWMTLANVPGRMSWWAE